MRSSLISLCWYLPEYFEILGAVTETNKLLTCTRGADREHFGELPCLLMDL